MIAGMVSRRAFRAWIAAVSAFSSLAQAETNCSFRAEPDLFLQVEARAHRAAYERAKTQKQGFTSVRAMASAMPASDVPRRNFVDDAIFGKMAAAQIASASLTTDTEFVRRIYLDLTGRIPSPDQIRQFVNDSNPGKRDELIGQLLYSPEFTDRWMLWLGDLMQNAAFNSQRNLQLRGRNAYYRWMAKSLDDRKTLRDLVWEALVSKGNNYDEPNGGVNWSVRSFVGGGPAQDQYDMAFSRAASQFLGIAHYDCILCHNGRGHIEDLSLWGKSATRAEAQQLAAFFSRSRVQGLNISDQQDFYYQSQNFFDTVTGSYGLNTNFGNRPNRTPVGALTSLTPVYRNGQRPTTNDWRAEFATFLVNDPQFAINMANRIWKQVFNLGLVEPVDQMDPARLDPANPPAAPWTLQATHPELLIELGKHLAAWNFDLREFVRTLVSSSAYQLSSRYDGEWLPSMVPYFARHYARRLEGEEIHDAIQQATGVMANYTVTGFAEPVRWALRLPEPVEPRSNNTANGFMNNFFRGNRDTTERVQESSSLQQLGLMNDTTVTNRIRVGQSPAVRRMAQAAELPAALDELYLAFLSRLPSEEEKAKSLAYIQSRGALQRNGSAEDLAWALINRAEFIFSY